MPPPPKFKVPSELRGPSKKAGGSGGGSSLPSPGPKAQERADSKERRSVGYSEKSLIRLLGRLSSTPELSDGQRDKLGTLLTGYKPKKIRSLARAAELPESLALELTDTARKAQGMPERAEVGKGEARLKRIVEKGAKSLEETGDWGTTPSGQRRQERAWEVAGQLPAENVKRATEALKALGDVPGMTPEEEKRQRALVVQAAGHTIDSGQRPGAAYGTGGSALGDFMDYIGRPGQVVLGTVAEGPGGAWKALSGQEHYTPIQSVLRATGKSEAEAAKAEGDLPGLVRFPANLAGYAASDPLTYLTFGTSAASKAAVRNLAPKIAAAGGRSVDDVIEGLVTSGVRSLDDVERAALPETQSLLRGLARQGPSTARAEKLLAGAPGGVKIKGRSIPGTSVTTPARKTGEVLGTAEKLLRPRAGIVQAERRGEEWARGLEPKLEALAARAEATKSFADRQLIARIQKAARGNKIGREKDLTEIRRSLDVGGADVALTGAQQNVRTELRSLMDEMLTAERAAGIDTAQLGAQAAAKQADDLAKKILKVEEQMDSAVGARYTNLDERFQALIAQRDEVLAKAAAAGDDYLQHIVVQPSWLQRKVTQRGRSPLEHEAAGFTKGRKIEGSIDEKNALAEAEGALGYETDPLKIVAHRGLQSNAKVVERQYANELMALPAPDGSSLFREVTHADDVAAFRDLGLVKAADANDALGLGEVWTHPEIATEFKRVMGATSSDDAVRNMMHAYDAAHRWWKGMATVPAPFSGGFSFRNMFSNWFNASWLPDPGARATVADYTKAGNLQQAAARGWRQHADPFKFLNDADAVKLRDAFQTGVLGQGFYVVDFEDVAQQLAKPRLRDVSAGEALKRIGKRANPLSPDFGPIEVGRAFNGAIENNARLALFLRNVDVLGADGAASLVRKYLFDYSSLTHFEQAYLKRVASFYTWTRKNLPLQLEAMLKTPGRFSRIEQVRWGILDEAEGQDTGPIPRWMGDQQGVVLPRDVTNVLAKIPGLGVEKDVPMMFMPDLPHLGVQETLGPLANLASNVPGLGSLSKGEGADRALASFAGYVGGPAGILRALSEIAAGKTYFSGREFYPGQMEEAPIYLEPFAGDAEVYAGKKPVPAVSPGLVNLLESAAPILSKIRTVAPTSQYDKDAAVRRRLNMISGLNLWPLGEATRRSELLRRLAVGDAIRTDLENRGFEVPDTYDLQDSAKAKVPKIDWKKLARNG